MRRGYPGDIAIIGIFIPSTVLALLLRVQMNLTEQLTLLLGDFSHLAPRVRQLNIDTSACGDRIDVTCSYIAFRDGTPTFDAFIDVIAKHIVPFCLPRSEILSAYEAMKEGDHVTVGRLMTELNEKARGLFIKAKKGSNRSGEGGEIVLYLLTEWLLKAPQIVSKMYLKTSNNMPLYGTDGIHARFDSATNRLFLYWGESKVHATLSSALGSALTSVKEFIDLGHATREIEIVSDFSDFHGMDAAATEAFLEYLNPYAEESNERVTTHSCLLVFQHEPLAPAKGQDPEEWFKAQIAGASNAFAKSVSDSVSNHGLGEQRFHFFLVPVPSAQDFRDKFQEKIGWPS